MVARKPLAGTVSQNILAHGTGALNIDGCRIGFQSDADERESKDKNRHADFGSGPRENRVYGADERNRGANGNYDAPGRWPSNVVLDGGPGGSAELLDQQTGELKSGKEAAGGHRRSQPPGEGIYGGGRGLWTEAGDAGSLYGDSGGASRFFLVVGDGPEQTERAETRFRYVAKASSAERNAGLDGFAAASAGVGDHRTSGDMNERLHRGEREHVMRQNVHPTVKSIELMRWLVRLVTPPGGLVLDPFAGSGSTGAAAMLEKVRFVGIEREPEYAAIARARIAWWAEHPDGVELVKRLEAERERKAVADAGQMGLFDVPAEAAPPPARTRRRSSGR